MMRNRIIPYCMTIVLCFINLTALAENESDHVRTLSPYMYIEGGDPYIDRMPLKSTDVKVNISGVIAEVNVAQKYANEGTRPINGNYVFPASTRAAVHSMKVNINGDIITAKAKERDSAQREYNHAKKQGKSASLLKQNRPNVFSMSVANIMPGDSIEIELSYTELIVPTDRTYQFVYPTVVGPRYSDLSGSAAGEKDSWIKTPYLKESVKPDVPFNIEVNISTGIPLREVKCASHDTDILFSSENEANIRLKDPEWTGADSDYILNYRLAGNSVQSGLILSKEEDENYFLLMAEPPEKIAASDIIPREYIFVVDVSGSMNGFPIDTAKKLLRDLIGGLKKKDLFNIVLFEGASKIFSPCSVPANEQNVQEALFFIERSEGSGGTELLSALKRGFAIPADDNISRSVLVITDGFIGAEKDIFRFIYENLNNTNVFAFGIGSSVNRYLVEGIARAGLGEPFIVTDRNEAESAASKFRDYISSPLLTDIEVNFRNFESYDMEPLYIPDLFASRPIIVIGKWKGKPGGFIEVKGTGGRGEYSKVFRMRKLRSSKTNGALKYLWARKRISRLSDFDMDSESRETKSEITNLGLKYNLLTEHTSFIAVHDEVRNTDTPSGDVKQPLQLPKGVTHIAVSEMAKVPEPGLCMLTVVLIAITAAGRIRRTALKTGKIILGRL